MIDSIIVGDTLDFETEVPDYPATDGWTLYFRLVPRVAGAAITITCATAANGIDYRAQVAPATTATWTAGEYTWNSYVAKSGARYTVEDGQVTLLPDPGVTTAPFDNRSHARKTLAAIEAVIEGRASQDQMEYSIGDRSLKRMPIVDLLMFRTQYRAEVRREDNDERIANGQPTNNRILVRM